MAENLELVRKAIETIKNEVEDGANTAARVGGAMSSILEYGKEQTDAEIVRAKAEEERINANTGISTVPYFGTNSTYAVGDRVLYGGLLYEFTSAKTAGSWDTSKVKRITIAPIIFSSTENIIPKVTDSYDIGSAVKSYAKGYVESVRRLDLTAKTKAFLHLESNSFDSDVLRISSSDGGEFKSKSAYGFTMKYKGTGAGNKNYLQVLADNGTADNQIMSMCFDQAGNVGIHGENNAEAALKVNGTAKITGNTEIGGTAKITGDTTIGGKAIITGNAEISNEESGIGKIRLIGNANRSLEIVSPHVANTYCQFLTDYNFSFGQYNMVFLELGDIESKFKVPIEFEELATFNKRPVLDNGDGTNQNIALQEDIKVQGITPTLTSGTEIAKVATADGEVILYAPTSTGSGEGSPTGNIIPDTDVTYTVGQMDKSYSTMYAQSFRRQDLTKKDAAFLHLESNSIDSDVLRISSSDGGEFKNNASYGFTLRYIGSGAGNKNYLQLLADNSTQAAQRMSMCFDQAGNVGIRGENDNEAALKVNGTTKITGNTTIGGTTTMSGSATVEGDMSISGALKVDGLDVMNLIQNLQKEIDSFKAMISVKIDLIPDTTADAYIMTSASMQIPVKQGALITDLTWEIRSGSNIATIDQEGNLAFSETGTALVRVSSTVFPDIYDEMYFLYP